MHYLERYLNGKWYLCSECFTLHPSRMFAKYEKSIVPWLKDYYKLKGSKFRSYRHGRKNLCAERVIAYAPSGIVGLCPCIKLTIGKKRQIEARLREDVRKIYGNDRPAADFWWHKCRHVYGDIEVVLQIGLFLYDGTERTRFGIRCTTTNTNIFIMPPRAGDLGVLREYRHTYPATSWRTSPMSTSKAGYRHPGLTAMSRNACHARDGLCVVQEYTILPRLPYQGAGS